MYCDGKTTAWIKTAYDVAGRQTWDGSRMECQGSVLGFPGHVHCRGPHQSSLHPLQSAGQTGSTSGVVHCYCGGCQTVGAIERGSIPDPAKPAGTVQCLDVKILVRLSAPENVCKQFK